MSATLLALNLLPPRSHVICSQDCYGGTMRTMDHARDVLGLDVTYVDLTDLDAIAAAFAPHTRMVWIETPSNPLLHLTDIEAVAALAKAHDALTVVDNTFLSPVWQRPFELGADVVIHSTTKYLNGHSDVVGGVVVVSKWQTELAERVQSMANVLGVTQSPQDCSLVLRGLKTLNIRMRAHEQGAHHVAFVLANHPKVARVYYPGLDSHPQHALAKKQQRGFGAMMAFALNDESRAGVDHIMRTLRWFTLAESLGGVESLIAHPASMTHASMTPEARARAGITDNILRLSVGIEDPGDLVADLERALAGVP
jgi:cystathionine gamma-synthase